jgi:hypothetical protein
VAEKESEEVAVVGTDEDDEEINLRKKPMGDIVQRKAPAIFDDNDDNDDSEYKLYMNN